jgi:hypothetical protein
MSGNKEQRNPNQSKNDNPGKEARGSALAGVAG